MGWLIPNENNLKKLPAALAHETTHNARYQFIKYATVIHGEEFLGPWVSKTDPELLL